MNKILIAFKINILYVYILIFTKFISVKFNNLYIQEEMLITVHLRFLIIFVYKESKNPKFRSLKEIKKDCRGCV